MEHLEQALRDYEEAGKLLGRDSQRDISNSIRETKLQLKKAKRKDYYKILGMCGLGLVRASDLPADLAGGNHILQVSRRVPTKMRSRRPTGRRLLNGIPIDGRGRLRMSV